jgi:Glycosyltransferase family 92
VSDSPARRPFAARWQAFTEFAQWALSKPAFEAEERKPRLWLAKHLRRVPGLAADGENWLRPYRGAIGVVMAGGNLDLTLIHPRDELVFRELLIAEDHGLMATLGELMEEEMACEERFDRILTAIEDAQADDKDSLPVPALVALGSLFNFAASPFELPLVDAVQFGRVEAALGFGYNEFAPPADQYRHHVRFANEVRERLSDAGVEVADMLDVNSLILHASDQIDHWLGSRPGQGFAAHGGKPPRTYLAVCASYRDEAPYLAEWVEFHRLVGVERFFLYDNGSKDDHLDRLAPYIDDGTVVLYDWPAFPGQVPAYEDCLRAHRDDAHWIAFLDLDIFLFSPTGESVAEVLTEYERWPAVGVNIALFWTSGHRTKPEGLVIENYVRRLERPSAKQIKTIVNPRRTLRPQTPHHFLYPYLSAVDENGYPITKAIIGGAHTRSPSFSRLRLNHYRTKSEQEFVERFEWAASLDPPGYEGTGHRSEFMPATEERLETMRAVEEREGIHDEEILRYLPALKSALALRR